MSAAPSRGLVALLKQGWHEIPEVIGSTFMALVGVSLGVAGVVNYYRKDGDSRRYKYEYTVLRHDDPMVKRVRQD